MSRSIDSSCRLKKSVVGTLQQRARRFFALHFVLLGVHCCIVSNVSVAGTLLVDSTTVTATRSSTQSNDSNRDATYTLNGRTTGTSPNFQIYSVGADLNAPSSWRQNATLNNNDFGSQSSWSASKDYPVDHAWIIWDLGDDTELEAINLFPFATTSTATNRRNRAVRDAKIYYRSSASGIGNNTNNDTLAFDPTGWTLLENRTGANELPMPDGAETAMEPVTIETSRITARYVAVDIDTSWGSGIVGIGEVQFFEYDPTPPPPPLDPPPVAPGPADLNQNGIPDLAELTVPAIAEYPAADDSDGDGVSNLDEVKAGTDPFNRHSVFGRVFFAYTSGAPDRVDFTFDSVEGVRYEVAIKNDLSANMWTVVTPEVIGGVGDETSVSYDPATLGLTDGSRCFFRASILPSLDSDSDGLEDNLERYLGFDPDRANSVRSASGGFSGDYIHFFRMLTGAAPDGGIFNDGTEPLIGTAPSEEQASRFFAQAAFGADQDMIDDLRVLGENAYEKWIDTQIALPVTYMSPYLSMIRDRIPTDAVLPNPSDEFYHPEVTYALRTNNLGQLPPGNSDSLWMRHALVAPDKLRHRAAWALSQIVVCSRVSLKQADSEGSFYDLVLDGALGDFEDFLYQASIHPLMGRYLSSLGNKKADPSINRMPDENFAREIMQLFSIGLWELNMDGTRKLDINNEPIPTYTNDDIVQVARVFTGMSYDNSGGSSQRYVIHPMLMNESDHDTGDATSVSVYGVAEKTFLQGAFYTPPSLPAYADDPGRTGFDDIKDTVEILFNHPSCPPFICKNLIQHLVTSNPSPEYVEDVANVFVNDGTGARGNLAAVFKAILLHEDARSLNNQFHEHQGRLKGPVLRFVTLAKAMEAGKASTSLHDLNGIQFWDPNPEFFSSFNEAQNAYPSVFNFYEPGYSLPGEVTDLDLVSPEFQILDTKSAITMPNRYWYYINRIDLNSDKYGTPPPFKLDFDLLTPLVADHDALLDKLNLMFCHGQLSSATRADIKATLVSESSSLTNEELAQLALYLVMTSPDSAVLN